MGAIVYRELEIQEARWFGAIDRSEHVDGVYRLRNGALELNKSRHEVSSWSAAELVAYVSRLQSLVQSGGYAASAWHERSLVGVGSLDPSGVGGDRAVVLLDMLYVSAGSRGRGIGRTLCEMAASRARSLGATSLYISATPTRATVDFYLRMGAELLSVPDPELLACEPDDIHLLLRLV